MHFAPENSSLDSKGIVNFVLRVPFSTVQITVAQFGYSSPKTTFPPHKPVENLQARILLIIQRSGLFYFLPIQKQCQNLSDNLLIIEFFMFYQRRSQFQDWSATKREKLLFSGRYSKPFKFRLSQKGDKYTSIFYAKKLQYI